MSWKKLGMVFKVKEHNIDWIRSHAMLPTPIILEDRIRVFYSARDINNNSRICFFDLDKNDVKKVIYVHKKPVISLGELGTFDDSGTLATCAVKVDNKKIYLYYNGYNKRVTVPYSNSIGVAVSEDNGFTFKRIFKGPIIDRNNLEPYFTVGAFVLKEDDIWRMWYASAEKWILVNGKPESIYYIKYAESNDGLAWKRNNTLCIKPKTNDEANARGTVLKEDNIYKMWFSYRGSYDFRDGYDSYSIGYAESKNGIDWERKDEEAGIKKGPESYDNKMQAYPFVICIREKKYMFYNGNGFGIEGVCLAEWI